MSIEKLFSILLSDKPSTELINNETELFELIPELKVCKGFEQKNEWHVFDVYEHILHVVDYVPNDLHLRLAALFHDIGNPISFFEDENGVGHFYGHWETSQKIFDSFAKQHELDKDFAYKVSKLIYYHDLNLHKVTNEELINITSILGTDGITDLYFIKKADLLSQNSKFHYLLDDYARQEEYLQSMHH